MEYLIVKSYYERKGEKALPTSIKVYITLSIIFLILMIAFEFIKGFEIFSFIPFAGLVVFLCLFMRGCAGISKSFGEDEYNKRLDILNSVLKDYKVNGKEEIKCLIDVYEIYIHEHNDSFKRMNKIMAYIYSAILSILLALLPFFGSEGLMEWFKIVGLFVVIAGAITGYFYIAFSLDGTKTKYNRIIKDLKILLALKRNI